jgi:outer membrane protein assembly factor BamA
LTLSNVSREDVNDPQSPNTVSRFLFIPEGKYVHDDVLWSYSGPVRGTRYNLGFFGVPKFTSGGIGFMTFTGDFRFYYDFTSYLSIALRGAAGASFGPNPLIFKLGGLENWMNPFYYGGLIPFYEPEDFAFMEHTIVMPLRGFGINQSRGSKYFLTNIELRFPLFRALIAGPLPILIQNIMGSFFMDLGGAWDDEFVASRVDVKGNRQIEDLLMSMGIGIRTYLLGIPIKLDIAWRNEYYAWSKPLYLFSLGYDF